MQCVYGEREKEEKDRSTVSLLALLEDGGMRLFLFFSSRATDTAPKRKEVKERCGKLSLSVPVLSLLHDGERERVSSCLSLPLIKLQERKVSLLSSKHRTSLRVVG